MPTLPKMLVYRTGAEKWDRYDAWPSGDANKRSLYLSDAGKLGFIKATASSGPSTYVSDPSNPVPVVGRPDRSGMPRDYMTGDNRFASARKDVLTFQTEPLAGDVTIYGPVSPVLYVSTSGTDADFDVKLKELGNLQRSAEHHAGARLGVGRLGRVLAVDGVAAGIERGVVEGEGGVAVVLHAPVPAAVAERGYAGASHGAAASGAGSAAASAASAARHHRRPPNPPANRRRAYRHRASAAAGTAGRRVRRRDRRARPSAASAGAITAAGPFMPIIPFMPSGPPPMPSMRPPGPPNQSFCCGMSRPRLTLPLTSSDGSALLLRSAISLAARPVSGAADGSPEEFTSTRW